MRKLLSLVLVTVASLMYVGCSNNSSSVTAPSDENFSQRPDFVDNRPQAVIEQSTLQADADYAVWLAEQKDNVDHNVKADPNPNPKNKYAYIVGVSNYSGTSNDLQYCDDDARDWKTYLTSQGFTVRMDLDLAATKTNITAGLNWLKTIAVAGDEIVFCYSGHGTKSGSTGSCMISTDMYYLGHAWAMQYINGSKATKKCVTLDACYIGDFHNDAVNGMVVATASTNTYSYDGTSSMANGAWTYYFMEGLKKAGTYNYAEVSANYAKTKMTTWGQQNGLSTSPKNTDKYSGDYDF